jgi:macrolide transport system ATP-binding/permease protein
MRTLRAALTRLLGICSRHRREDEFATEIETHVQMQIDDNVRSGMSLEEARRAALMKLGGVEQTKQAYRERGTMPLVESVWQDLRFTFRQLIKNPAFAVTAIVVLALGLGASVAIFAFVDAALIKPLPYRDPSRLVYVTESVPMIPLANLSYMDYQDWKKQNRVFTSMDAMTGSAYSLNTPSGLQLAPGARVSAGFFRTLGVVPILGRDFLPNEDSLSAAHAVILSYNGWQKWFAGRPDAIGQSITLSGVTYTIVGVLPQDFHFALRGRAEFWAALQPVGGCEKRRSCHNLIGVARLKDGVSVATAKADLVSVARQLEAQYAENKGQSAAVLPLSESILKNIRPILLLLLGGAFLLLLIACVNVASLLLVRSESRKREIAVRGALGAGPARLIRQFMTEGFVLVAASSVLALAGSYAAMRVLLSLIPKDMLGNMPYLQSVELNGRVLAFAGAMALLVAILFSLTPLLRVSFSHVRDGLGQSNRGYAGTAWRRLGANLIVVELATAVVLLVAAGLLGKSFYKLSHVELGFQPDHLATVGVMAPDVGYEKDEQLLPPTRKILERVAALPGVQSAAVTTMLPVTYNGNTTWIRFVGRPFHGEHNEVNERDVSANYFQTIKPSLISGRYFTETDDAKHPGVVIINRKLANQYFPGEDPLGKQIGDTELSAKSLRQIVGVVDDLRESPLDEQTWPAVYIPFEQSASSEFSVVLRTSQAPEAMIPTLLSAVHQAAPDFATLDEDTMERRISDSESAYLHRSSAWLVGGYAGLALLLAVVGLYGVIAYSVSQRTREIGVRMALGAQRASVYQLVMSEAGWLTGVGILAGLLCSVGAAALMRKLLFGVQAWDFSTLLAVSFVLAAAALVASYLPARRAASVNPVDALRAE